MANEAQRNIDGNNNGNPPVMVGEINDTAGANSRDTERTLIVPRPNEENQWWDRWGQKIVAAAIVIALLLLVVVYLVGKINRVSGDVTDVRKDVVGVKLDMVGLNTSISNLTTANNTLADGFKAIRGTVNELVEKTNRLVDATNALVDDKATRTELARVERRLNRHIAAVSNNEEAEVGPPATQPTGRGKIIIETRVVPRKTSPIPVDDGE